MDKSGPNKVAIDTIKASRKVLILVLQVANLNNVAKQDHHAIERVNRSMLNLELFRAANSVLAGIELIHFIRQGKFAIDGADAM